LHIVELDLIEIYEGLHHTVHSAPKVDFPTSLRQTRWSGNEQNPEVGCGRPRRSLTSLTESCPYAVVAGSSNKMWAAGAAARHLSELLLSVGQDWLQLIELHVGPDGLVPALFAAVKMDPVRPVTSRSERS